MELNQLYQFSILARMNSVTRAAQKLYITQPALSNTISRLENELGVKLFHHKGNRIELNAAGQLFLKYVDAILTGLDEGVSEVRELESSVAWDISYSVPNGGLMTDLKFSFIREHPEIRLHQHFMAAEQAREALLSGEIQFALSYRPIIAPQIQWDVLTESDLVFLASEEHPLFSEPQISLSGLIQYPFLTSEPSQDIAEVFIASCRNRGFVPRVAFSGDEPRLISSIMKDNRSIFITHRVLTTLEPPVHANTSETGWVPMRELHAVDFTGYIKIGIAKLSETVLPRYAKMLYDFFFTHIQELSPGRPSYFKTELESKL